MKTTTVNVSMEIKDSASNVREAYLSSLISAAETQNYGRERLWGQVAGTYLLDFFPASTDEADLIVVVVSELVTVELLVSAATPYYLDAIPCSDVLVVSGDATNTFNGVRVTTTAATTDIDVIYAMRGSTT